MLGPQNSISVACADCRPCFYTHLLCVSSRWFPRTEGQSVLKKHLRLFLLPNINVAVFNNRLFSIYTHQVGKIVKHLHAMIRLQRLPQSSSPQLHLTLFKWRLEEQPEVHRRGWRVWPWQRTVWWEEAHGGRETPLAGQSS